MAELYILFLQIRKVGVVRMGKILGVSKVTKKYQVTIPKRAREILGITENDLVVFELEENKIIIKKA